MNTATYRTPRYRLDIETEDWVGRIILTDTYSGVEFADAEYRYSAFVESGDHILRLEGLYGPTIEEEETPDRGGMIVTLSGYLGGPSGGVRLGVRHRLYIPEEEDFLEEQIILRNDSQDKLVLRGYRFGFRKLLEQPKRYGGPGTDIENYRLIALPFRLQPDGTKHDYQLDDIYRGRYQTSEFYNPARLVQEVVDKGRARSEGWAWTDGENGLLMVKHNPGAIEYSMLDTEKRDDGTYLSFGGASPSLYNEPVEARCLNGGERIDFGVTRYHFYEGLWRRGAYMFREYMDGFGHGIPDDYSPRLLWCTQYDVGSNHGDPEKLAEHYTLEALEEEARKAREIGCEALFLGPGWDVCEGGTIWDTKRLGEADEFVRRIKDEYGMDVGFRAIGRSYRDDYPGLYRRRPDGSVGYYAPYHEKPFYEPCFCNPRYQQAKLGRVMKLIEAGMSFVSFDEFDWRGPCFDPEHGHAVPTTPNLHARQVTELIRAVREKAPGVNIEAHDPVWPWGIRYLPAYYLHETGTSFEELWGFELGRHALDDLLSGRALSLFYYNLAYSIPLHVDISMEHDNDNCLAFWWYASTVRHLGIGGVKGDSRRFEAYKSAVALYKSLRELYTRGTFHALDELTHIHVLADSERGVVNAFNLTDQSLSRLVEIRLSDLGFFEDVKVEGASYEVVRGKLVLDLEVSPFGHALVKFGSEL